MVTDPIASAAPCANIAAHLPPAARAHPQQRAVIFPHGRDRAGRVSYTQYSYAQLDRESDLLARGLQEIGIGPGVRAVLMVPPSLEFFALVFGLFKAGAVMVCVDPGMGVKNLGRCLAEAEPEAFVGIPKAHAARLALRWGRRSIRTCVHVGGPGLRFGSGPRLEAVRAHGERHLDAGQAVLRESWPHEEAAILFTSGSTGVPKGVVYRHEHFQAQVRSLRDEFAIEPGEVDLATFPLFALFAPALGMTAVVPDMDFTRPGQVDPRRILEPIENFGVTNLFGSPALLDRLGRFGEANGLSLPTLRRVISAGAPVSPRIIRRIQTMLAPGAEVFTPYGATESLPVTSIGSTEILGETAAQTDRGAGTCVGRPIGGVEVRLMQIDDRAVESWRDELCAEPGAVGEVVVRGPVVTDTYYGREEATRLAKIRDADGAVLHRMGDLGRLDERGRLWFCGRKSQRVTTESGTLFTVPCEGVFNTHPRVYRSALVGVRRDSAVRPVLCVELEPGDRGESLELLRRELGELAASEEHTRSIRDFLVHPGFPVDIRHNAKIDRQQLARWAGRQLGAP